MNVSRRTSQYHPGQPLDKYYPGDLVVIRDPTINPHSPAVPMGVVVEDRGGSGVVAAIRGKQAKIYERHLVSAARMTHPEPVEPMEDTRNYLNTLGELND